MNYRRIYSDLVEMASKRDLCKPYDTHHIKPRMFGGDNSKSNLVRLTTREHIFAHALLAKIHRDNFGMVSCAFRMMNGCRSSKRASWLRKRFVDGISGDKNPLKNKETAKRVSEKLKNVPRSEDTRKKVSEGLKRFFSENKKIGTKHSEETKKKLADNQRGRKQTKEMIDARVKSVKGKIWATDGKEALLVTREKFEKLLLQGWKRGRK